MTLALSPSCVTGRCLDCPGFIATREPDGSRGRKPCGCSHHGGTGALSDAIAATRAARPAAGPGGLLGVIVDPRHAVAIDDIATCPIDEAFEQPPGPGPVFALWLSGKVGGAATQRTSVLYLLGPASAAGLVAEVAGVVARAGPDATAAFEAELAARYAAASPPPT